MTGRRACLVVGAIWCVVAAVAPAFGEPPAVGVNSSLLEYTRKVKSMDAPAIASTFTSDGELLEPGMKALRGRAAIQAFLASLTGARVESVTMQAEATEVWGSNALQWGTYSQRVVVGDKPAAEYSGRFALQWARDASGAWLIRRLMMQPVTQ